MPSTYSRNLRLELMATGEQPGTWGETTNINLQAIDDTMDGFHSQPIGQGGMTISTDNAPAMSAGRSRILEFNGDVGGPSGGATITIAPNDAEKWYFVRNVTNGPITFQQGSGASYRLEGGSSAVIHCSGSGSEASVFGTLSSIQYDTLLVTGTATIKGAVTLESTLSVTGASTLTGAVSCGATLNVTGASTLTGAVNCGSTLTVAGVATMNSNLGVGGTLAVSGISTLVGSVACGADLAVSGAATFVGAVTVSGQITAGAGLQINIGGDAAYDTYFRSAAGPLSRLANGVAGQYLRASAAGPAWQGLDIPVGTPVSGAAQGQVLFVWDNKVAVAAGFYVRNTPGNELALVGASGAMLVLESIAADTSNVIRFRQGGFVRWDFMMRTVIPGQREGTWCLVRYPSGDVNFEIIRENGHVLMGRIDHNNVAGAVNIQPNGTDVPLVIRRGIGGTQADLLVFQNEAGSTLSYFDYQGVYHSSAPGTGWTLLPRTVYHYALTGPTAGALFFYHPTPGLASDPGGFLSFGYGLGDPDYGTFYAQLPESGGVSAPIGGLMWAYRGNRQPPLAYANFDDYIRFNDEAIFLRLLNYPDLMERLKERLAA